MTYYSGTDSTDEPDLQPWTYKKRGVWLDGDDVLTLKVDTNFILHSYMTFYAWIRPKSEAGSLFSKSYADYAVVGDSDFFDVYLDTSGQLKVDITLDGNKSTATIQAAVTVQNWYFIGFTLTYDRDNLSSNIQGYANGSTRNLVALSPCTILEKSNSEGAIGARLDSDGAGSSTLANHYTGFIYSLNYKGNIDGVSESSMNGLITIGSSCTGSCSTCPTSDAECLWNCDIDEYLDSALSSCFDCPTCPT